jgi:D-amino-acid dehydrogenase
VEWLQDRVQVLDSDTSGVTVKTVSGRAVRGDRAVLASGVWSNHLIEPLGFRVPLLPKRGYHTMFARPAIEVSRPVMSATRHVLLTPMAAGLRVSGTSARQFVPELGGEGISEWMGQRPMVADSLPVIGPLPGRENVVCAFGHGHYGLTQGPTTGKLVARLLFARDPGIDLTPYSIARF